eukprot:scaffold48748_cov66-Phaeocystis_antarctica.AAC.3
MRGHTHLASRARVTPLAAREARGNSAHARARRARAPRGRRGENHRGAPRTRRKTGPRGLVSVLPTTQPRTQLTPTHCIPLRTGLLHRPRASSHPATQTSCLGTCKAACAVRNPSPPCPGARAALPSSWRRCRPPRAGRSGSTRPGGTPSRASPGCRRPTRRGCCR